jgi:hypothetical protein
MRAHTDKDFAQTAHLLGSVIYEQTLAGLVQAQNLTEAAHQMRLLTLGEQTCLAHFLMQAAPEPLHVRKGVIKDG